MLKAWIDSLGQGEDGVYSGPTDKLLSPSQIHSAQHHYMPSNLARRVSQDGFVDIDDDSHDSAPAKALDGVFFGTKEPEKGRKWDHCRQDDPVIMQSGIQRTSQWTEFARSSMCGPAPNGTGEMVDNEFLDSQSPGLNMPWRGNMSNADPEKGLRLLRSKKQRKIWYQRIQVRRHLHDNEFPD